MLAAAAAVISESGPRAATLKNIASHAGITEPAIFRHFDGVDGLFGGLYDAFALVCQRIEDAFKVEERGLARLRCGFETLGEIVAEGGDFAYILLHGEQVFRGYPDLYKKVSAFRTRNQGVVLACIEEGVARGEVRVDIEPASLAAAALGAMQLAILAWIEEGFRADIRSRCAQRWEGLERLLSSAPPSRTAVRRSSSAKPSATRVAATRTSSTKSAASKPAAALKATRAPIAKSATAKGKTPAKAKPKARAAVASRRA